MLFPGEKGLEKGAESTYNVSAPGKEKRRGRETIASRRGRALGKKDSFMKAAVFGAGNMGLDIAQVFAVKGHDVVVRDISDELIQKGEERLKVSLARQVEKGRRTQAEADAISAKIVFTTNMRQAADADLIVEAIVENTVESLNRRYSTMQIVGDHLAELIPQGGTILTQCFGETIIGTVIRAARRQNKDFKVFCAETRPYLQGARLTSGCFAQMGFDTTVITDNMVAYAMEREGIDLFTSAADTIARDGHIANKIGTFQIAILAKYFGIPYYVTGIPDQDKHSKDDIVIEMRDPQQVLSYRGIPNTVPEVKAIYPSFDVVPPHLISGVVTDKGVYVPYLLDHYFDSDVKKFY